MAGDDRAARRRHVEPAEDVQERALARAGGTDQRDELARLDEQVEALEGDDLEVGDLVDLDQVVAHDQRLVAVARPLPLGGPIRRRRQVDDLGQLRDLGPLVGHDPSVTIVTYSSPIRMTRPSSSRPTSHDAQRDGGTDHEQDRDDDRPDRRPVDLEPDRRVRADELGEPEPRLEQHRHAEPERDADDDARPRSAGRARPRSGRRPAARSCRGSAGTRTRATAVGRPAGRRPRPRASRR